MKMKQKPEAQYQPNNSHPSKHSNFENNSHNQFKTNSQPPNSSSFPSTSTPFNFSTTTTTTKPLSQRSIDLISENLRDETKP